MKKHICLVILLTMILNLISFSNVYAQDALYGDVNGDGSVNTTDVTLMMQHCADWNVAGFNVQLADVNCDGFVNTTDITLVVQSVAGWGVHLGPAAGPTATPAPTAEPTPAPTAEPTPAPTAEPTPVPTAEPPAGPTFPPMTVLTPTPTPSSQQTPAPIPTEYPLPQGASEVVLESPDYLLTELCDFDTGTIAYTTDPDASASALTLVLKSDVSVIVNRFSYDGFLNAEDAIDILLSEWKSGSVRFINLNPQEDDIIDVVDIMTYMQGVVQGVDTENKVISITFATGDITGDIPYDLAQYSDGFNMSLKDTEGNAVSFEDLKPYDVLAVALGDYDAWEYYDARYMEIVVVRDKVYGTVTERNYFGSKYRLTLDNQQTFVQSNAYYAPNEMVGEIYGLCLDIDGKYIFSYHQPTTGDYAVVSRLINHPDGYRVKMLDKNGVFANVPFADEVVYVDENDTTTVYSGATLTDLYTLLDSKVKETGTPANERIYSITKVGNAITKICAPQTYVRGNEGLDKFAVFVSGGELAYSDYSGGFFNPSDRYNSYYTSPMKTTVFYVPSDNTSKWRIVDIEDITSTTYNGVYLYNYDSRDAEIGLVLFTEHFGFDGYENASLALVKSTGDAPSLVDGVSNVLNVVVIENGIQKNYRTCHYGYDIYKPGTTLPVEYDVAPDGFDFTAGDVVILKKNDLGEIVAVADVFDYQTKTISGTNDYLSGVSFAFAKLTKKGEDFAVSCDNETEIALPVTGKTSFALFDGVAKIATTEDLVLYSASKPSYLLTMQKDGYVTSAVNIVSDTEIDSQNLNTDNIKKTEGFRMYENGQLALVTAIKTVPSKTDAGVNVKELTMLCDNKLCTYQVRASGCEQYTLASAGMCNEALVIDVGDTVMFTLNANDCISQISLIFDASEQTLTGTKSPSYSGNVFAFGAVVSQRELGVPNEGYRDTPCYRDSTTKYIKCGYNELEPTATIAKSSDVRIWRNNNLSYGVVRVYEASCQEMVNYTFTEPVDKGNLNLNELF